MHFRLYEYRNCIRAINYFIIIKHDYCLKFCLISPYSIHTLNKRKKKKKKKKKPWWLEIRIILHGLVESYMVHGMCWAHT